MGVKDVDIKLGVDIAVKGAEDDSCIVGMCTHCNTICFVKHFNNDEENYLSIELPTKCSNCGKKFVTYKYGS